MIYLDMETLKRNDSIQPDSEFSIDALKQNYKQSPKLHREYNIQIAYQYALENYVQVHNLPSAPHVLTHPHNFFRYYDNSVHFAYNRAFPIKNNIQGVFSDLLHLPCSLDLTAETKLLYCLEKLLKLSQPLSKIGTLLYEFEKNDFHPFPINLFFILEGTLCVWNSVTKCTALTSGYLQSMGESEQKRWAKNIPLLKALKSSRLLLAFSYSKDSNPYYMSLKIANQSVSIKYNEQRRNFEIYKPIPASLTALCISCQRYDLALNGLDISHLFYYTKCNNFEKKNPTDKVTHFLYQFTNGNFQNFINLAILCANIASPEILTPNLFLVTCNQKSSFYQVLDYIFNPEENKCFARQYSSISKLIQKKSIPDMANHFFDGIKLLYLDKGTVSLNDEQIKKLKQYLKGSKISSKDSKFGLVAFRNMSPVICFSNNHKETAYLEQNLPCTKIDLDFIENPDSLQVPNPHIDSEVYDWLRLYLPLYGLYLLAEKKFHRQPLHKVKKVKTASSTDGIINDFVNTCCTLSENDFEYTDMLYQAYTVYYQSLHKSEPLKRTQFVKTLKQVPGLIYKRPHVSRAESNKYAFTGICLKPDWELCFTSSADSLSVEEEAFKKKLQEIVDLFPSYL